MIFTTFKTEAERQEIIAEMLTKGYLQAGEHNIREGNFLAFYESTAELEERSAVTNTDLKTLQASLDDMKANITAIKTEVNSIKTRMATK
jgi:capsule polysaccharide export protein KpsE/RkpR